MFVSPASELSINTSPGLTRSNEYQLIESYKRGLAPNSTPSTFEEARAAQEKLIIAHQGLVAKIASRYSAKHRGHVEFEDLVSAGNQGLLVALDRFEPAQGNRFNTYARWWIHNKVGLWIRQERWRFRIPDNAYKKALKVLRIMQEITSEGRTPKAEEIALRADIPVSNVHEVFAWINPEFISLDIPVGEDHKSTLADCLIDRWGTSPWEAVSDSRFRNAVRDVLETLRPKEEKILRLLFGIGCYREHTLEEIAAEFDVTVSRIRAIERKAVRKLREPDRARRLRPWIRAGAAQTAPIQERTA